MILSLYWLLTRQSFAVRAGLLRADCLSLACTFMELWLAGKLTGRGLEHPFGRGLSECEEHRLQGVGIVRTHRLRLVEPGSAWPLIGREGAPGGWARCPAAQSCVSRRRGDMLGSGSSIDRGRLRQLLRSSVAGLCELRLLRERQEVRVRRALRGGEDLDRQLWELERQLGELRLRAESANQSVDYETEGPESCDVFLDGTVRTGQAEARMHYASERPKSAGDLVVGSQHARSSSSRLLVPRSMSAPYPSPSSPAPPPARRAEGYILSLLRRQLRTPYMRSVSVERPAPPPATPVAPPSRIPNSSSYTPPHRGNRRKHPPLLKGRSVEGSPPRPPRKCLSAEEPPRKRGGRRTPRSLSETSLRDPAQHVEDGAELRTHAEVWEGSRGNLDNWSHPRNHRQSWANARSHTEGWADHQQGRGHSQEWGEGPPQEAGRCYTLGRDGRLPPVRVGPPCRKWRSTAEISAGVPEGSEPQVDSEGGEAEEEEDEGEMVWPMQLPPRDAEGRPQVFKVKASQALKKKIMRFHTGSLKVMTTV